jgi:phosphoenolpyruvate---glycerone phosphotransferase subunit DhaK
MKKILNNPVDYVDEMLAGLTAAHPEYYRLHGDSGRVVARAKPGAKGKVGIVTGGGSGHLPVFTGYVGTGLLDACAIGDVFASPSAEQMADAIRAADQGAGVLRLYGNYGGDIMNFDMAGDLVEFEDITCTTVILADDVASAPPAEREKRRGVAGMVYAFKIAGAAAEAGQDLAAVTRWRRRPPMPAGRSGRRCRPAPCRRRASPPSISRKTRWRWAWAFMASRVCGATSCAPPMPSRKR